jgi:hypothetical protein
MRTGSGDVSLDPVRSLNSILCLSCLLALLCARGVHAKPSGGDGLLSGVPIALSCRARLPEAHPLLGSHPGVDIDELRGEGEPDLSPARWMEKHLCGHIEEVLLSAGAHNAPPDLELPARAILDAHLVDAYLDGSRVVDQRIRDNLWPVSVPHWSLEMTWRVRFAVHYRQGVNGPALDLVLRGEAHQEDYQRLDLGLLLAAATSSAVGRLPRVLADEGRLGDLLFSTKDTAPEAPASWRVDGVMVQAFGLLISATTDSRHAALAIYLGSPLLPANERSALARWFAINDPDLPIRRDALAWLMRQEPEPGAGSSLSPETAELLTWLLHRATSHRVRVAAVMALADRSGNQVRRMLLIAATDADRRVADVALSQLRNFKAATASELNSKGEPPQPSLPAWTSALDGRMRSEESADNRTLLTLAGEAGGSAANLWLVRWLQRGPVKPDDRDWALATWQHLSRSESIEIREATLQRLIRERQLVGVGELLRERAQQETEVALRVVALGHLDDGPTELQLLMSTAAAADPLLRRAAATALATQKAGDAELRLRTLARSDPDRKVRVAARKALRKRAKASD